MQRQKCTMQCCTCGAVHDVNISCVVIKVCHSFVVVEWPDLLALQAWWGSSTVVLSAGSCLSVTLPVVRGVVVKGPI